VFYSVNEQKKRTIEMVQQSNMRDNKDRSVFQCKSKKEENDGSDLAIKYDEKITIKAFDSVNPKKRRTMEVIRQSNMMRK
jgi:hypothetical protein